MNKIPFEDKDEIVSTYGKLIELSIRMRDFNNAKSLIEDASEFMVEEDNKFAMMKHEILAEISINMRDYQDAASHYTEALDLIEDNNFEDYYRISKKIAKMYEDILNYEYAIESFTNILHSIPRSEYKKLAETKIDVARVNLKLGNTEVANEYFGEALSYLSSIDSASMYDLYEGIGKSYEDINEYEGALRYYKLAFEDMPTSLYSRRINNLIIRATIYKKLDDSSQLFKVLLKARKLVKKDDYSNKWEINHRLGNFSATTGEYKEAFKYYNKAIENANKLENLKKYAISTFMKGKIFEKVGKIETAISTYEDAVMAMELSKSFTKKEIRMFGDMLFELSDLLRKNKEYDKALKFGKRSLEVLENMGSCYKVKSLLNLGNIYLDIKDYDKTQDYYEMALRCPGLTRSNTEYLAKVYNNMAVLASREGKFNEAIEYYNKSLTIKEANRDYQGMVNTFWNIAVLYEKKSMFDEAIAVLEKAVFLIDNYSLGNGNKFVEYIAELELLKNG